jgi:mono/diheme cytochrome c family protein
MTDRDRGAVTVALLLASVALGAAQTKSVWSGVYNAEQAEAGEKIYFDRCATCHGDDLGGVERAPALTGATFLESWHGKDLRRLIERIEAMPPTEPVSAAQAVEVLAFLLQSSEMPQGGSALPVDRAQLAAITFERARPKP